MGRLHYLFSDKGWCGENMRLKLTNTSYAINVLNNFCRVTTELQVNYTNNDYSLSTSFKLTLERWNIN